jgi:hypothetical protein
MLASKLDTLHKHMVNQQTKAINWGRSDWDYFPTKMLCITKMKKPFVGDILNPL